MNVKLFVKAIIAWCLALLLLDFILGNILEDGEILTSSGNPSNRRKRLPDAIIIGAMKGGTTTLHNFLFLHPDVKGLKFKEAQFFNFNFENGFNWYIEQMEAANEDEVVVEKSIYFHHKVASERIWKTFGNKIKLILIVKDPVERLLSQYAMQFDNSVFNRTFSSLAFKSIDGKLTVNTAYGPVNVSNYAKWMKIWLDAGFDLSNFLIIDGHKFSQDPLPELIKVEQFIGLRHMFSEDSFYFNETRGFACVRPNFTFANGSPSNLDGGCAEAECGRKHPTLKLNELNLLYQFYAPFNIEFFKLIRMEFPDWHFKTAQTR